MSKCKWYEVCPIKFYTDRGVLNNKRVNKYRLKSNKKCIRYITEEKGEYHPDNMLPDGTIDKT